MNAGGVVLLKGSGNGAFKPGTTLASAPNFVRVGEGEIDRRGAGIWSW